MKTRSEASGGIHQNRLKHDWSKTLETCRPLGGSEWVFLSTPWASKHFTYLPEGCQGHAVQHQTPFGRPPWSEIQAISYSDNY